MAALPPIRRLLAEDFKSQSTWISPLLLILNSFNESVVNLFNRNITIKDNTTSDIRTLTLVDTSAQSISLNKPNIPVGVLAIGASAVGGFTFTQTALSVQWAMIDNKTLQISNISGLSPAPSASNSYILTLLLIGG